MSLTDDFDGTFALIGTFTVTTPGGSSVVVPIFGIENLSFPPGENKEDKFVPISGVRTGAEQVIVCSKLAGDITAKLTYELANHIALDAIRGINGCTIALSLNDGLTLSATGAVKKVALDQIEDARHVTDSLAVAVNANWTLSDTGATVTRVGPFTVHMTAGTATIDLSNVNGANLTGLKVTKLALSALSTNANSVTVATGSPNGYAPVSGFSVVLLAGETEALTPLNAPTVGSGAKNIAVTGTLSQGVQVYIEAQAP